MQHPFGTIRIMTYNVHSCIGRDGKASTLRVADVIAELNPDIVALQELDAGKPRTGHIHQAEKIAEHLNMDFHFHPSIEVREERYGNAILSRHPIELIRAGALPSFRWWKALESRGAIWASVEVGGKAVQIINTHFGLNRFERLAQANALLGADWAAHSECKPPIIVCGDFNSIPLSGVYRRFLKIFRDAQLALKGLARPFKTYPSVYPFFRIDHIFLTEGVTVNGIEVPRTGITSLASDHLPLIADVTV